MCLANYSRVNVFFKFLQSHWGGPVSHAATGTHVAEPAAAAPSSTAATSSVQAISQNTTLAKCNWTEHLSPEGFKYYYNSVTGESRVRIYLSCR